MEQLTFDVFAASIKLLESHIRTRESDQLTPLMLELRFQMLQGEYPELGTAQFLWAVEQWVQGTRPDAFLRMPTWAELLMPLYRCENGRPNRSWGFRDDLPQFCRPQPWQLGLLPAAPCSIAPPLPEGAVNPGAYRVVGAGAAPRRSDQPLLPAPEPAAPTVGLSDEQWREYLASRPPVASETRAPAPAPPARVRS